MKSTVNKSQKRKLIEVDKPELTFRVRGHKVDMA